MTSIVSMEDEIYRLRRALAAEKSFGALLVTQLETQIRSWRAGADYTVKDIPYGCEPVYNCSARVHRKVADQLEQAVKIVMNRREAARTDDELWDAMHAPEEE